LVEVATLLAYFAAAFSLVAKSKGSKVFVNTLSALSSMPKKELLNSGSFSSAASSMLSSTGASASIP
jgi:hypothetical protein